MCTRPMHANPRVYGRRPRSRQHVRRGPDECLFGRLWPSGPGLDDLNLRAVVQDVLRDLHEHRARSTLLRPRKGFAKARADLLDVSWSGSKSRGRLKNVELSAQLMAEAAFLFDVGRFDVTGDQDHRRRV